MGAWHSLFSRWLPPDLAVAAVDELLELGMSAVFAITLAIFERIEAKADALASATGSSCGRRQLEPELFVGPKGFFSQFKCDLLQSCDQCELLTSRWRALLDDEEVRSAGDECYRLQAGDIGSSGLSSSMAGLVQREAVLHLALRQAPGQNTSSQQLLPPHSGAVAEQP